jgi:hypothetical protein
MINKHMTAPTALEVMTERLLNNESLLSAIMKKQTKKNKIKPKTLKS